MANGSTLITALQPVQPGDLIEADFFNKLIAAVQDLDNRLSDLETAKPAPDGGGSDIRPIAIETARVVVGRELAFEVTGSGLDPRDLEGQTFTVASIGVRSVSFQPDNLNGSDESITFTAELAQFAGATERSRMIVAVERSITLTIRAKRGVSAKHALEVVTR